MYFFFFRNMIKVDNGKEVAIDLPPEGFYKGKVNSP